jgi:hypothetical protein
MQGRGEGMRRIGRSRRTRQLSVGILNQHGSRRAEQGERFAGNVLVNHRRTPVPAQSARAGRKSIRSFLDGDGTPSAVSCLIQH